MFSLESPDNNSIPISILISLLDRLNARVWRWDGDIPALDDESNSRLAENMQDDPK